MPNRIFSQQSVPAQAFGLVGWLEQTRVQLPLKDVECRFHVCGELVNVEMDQIFHQNNPKAMDCLYTFPLPAGAAVYRCEMHVNGRVIRARVEEENRAREIAREQRAAGRRTALVEMERDNLFTLSLGNLQPGDVVVIRFGYFQTLTRLGDWTSMRIPVCPGVRYIPGQPLLRSLRGRGVADDTDQVPDASRISPPRIDALHPDASSLFVEGTLENPSGNLSDVSSASHPLLVRDTAEGFKVCLAEQGAVPDCDLALRWTEKPREDLASAAWVTRQGDEAYALVRLQAPRVDSTHVADPHDYYFLVDRSGSMQGLKWTKAVQAFRSFLNLLGPEDRAWATFFSSGHLDFAERPLRAIEWSSDSNLARLEKLGVDGGTELLPALRHVLNQMGRHSAQRPATLMLITDGQVGNESEIIECLGAHPTVRVHTFGIDTTVNDALLTRVAAQHRGACSLLQPTDDIVGAVTRLGNRLRRPVLTSIDVAEGWELPGTALVDLHSEESISLSLKGREGAKDISIKGRLPDGSERTYRFPLLERAEPALELLWARQRIERCLGVGQKGKAIQLAKQHNLLCPGVAFIAWDEQEKVAVASHEIYQPNPMNVRFCLTAQASDTQALFRGSCDTDLGPIVDYLKLDALAVDQDPRDPGIKSKDAARLPLLRWAARLSKVSAFAEVLRDRKLSALLIEWAVEDAHELPQRMEKLDGLLAGLERAAADLPAGLAVVRAWADRALAGSPEYHRRVLKMLEAFGAKTTA